MEELSIDNILSEEEIDNLFEDTELLDSSNEEDTPNLDDIKKTLETTEIDSNNLFEESESVGSEEDTKGKEGTIADKSSTSPNFYSSIATALRDSTFPDLDAENVKDAELFADAFEKLLQSRLDERQKRIDEALNNGIEPSVIKLYEGILTQLKEIKVEDLSKEDAVAENLRKNLIYRDLLNKGYSDEEAKEEISEIIESGNDIKRAERALKSSLNFFLNKYLELIVNAREEAAREENDRKALSEALKKDILSNSKAFGDIEVSKVNRQKAYDAISKPIYKDPDTGNYYTAIQKYEMEHKQEFLKNLGLLFVLTDNFTNLNNLIKDKVTKASRKAIRDLESTLNNTQRNSLGNLDFVSSIDEDTESSFRGYTLDV